MKKLIAGPWVGEFGWELFAWQGYIRALSRHFDETTVISRELSEPLYKDFSSNFIAHAPEGTIVDSFFMHGVDFSKDIKKVIIENNISLDSDTTLFVPRRIGVPPFTHFTQPVIFGNYVIKPEYKIYGKESSDVDIDYVFHIRNRQSVRPEDNWSIDNWKRLADLLDTDKIACIGTISESGWIDGTTDARDLELQKLFDLLYNTKCVFGPSSGPMHLASLCNTPHVVWSIENNKTRYEENWNPHNTDVCFFSDYNWHPQPEFVHQKFLEFKEKINS